MTEPDFWNDNIAAQKTSQELNELKHTYNTFHKMDELQDEVEILLDFLAEDESVKDELVEKLDELAQMMTSYEMTRSEEHTSELQSPATSRMPSSA